MADPKRVVERHVEAFNARDADAGPWSDDADLVAPNASVHGREEVGLPGCVLGRVSGRAS